MLTPSNLDSTDRLINEISEIIAQANEKIVQQNKTLDNLTQEKKKLVDQIWSYFISENIYIYNNYVANKRNLEEQISTIKNSINEFENGSEKMKGIVQYNKIISDLEAQQSSDQFVIKEINKMLNGFGFTGFSLKAAEKKGFYTLQRPNGTPAQQTLSEGEKTFIAFLYFYHLLKGSHNSKGIQDDKIVVFDDPISSLDSDVLFIVSHLIKDLFEEASLKSQIKQIFILTHNVYFHKEVCFIPLTPEVCGRLQFFGKRIKSEG